MFIVARVYFLTFQEYALGKYGYFIRPVFPYTVGCFKGKVKNTNVQVGAALQECKKGKLTDEDYL